MVATIFLLIAAVLAFVAGCGVDTAHVGSVSFHLFPMALFCLICAALCGTSWPWKRSN